MTAPSSSAFASRRTVSTWRGLSVKQAFATLVIALGLGAIAGVWDMVDDHRRLRAEVDEGITAELALVRGLAAEAAYLLNSDMAGEVVGGLALNPLVAEVQVRDNFGGILAHTERQPAVPVLPGLADRLFGDLAPHYLILQSVQDGTPADVGRIDLRLDTALLLNRYFGHVIDSVVSGSLRTVLLCLLVVLVFYVLITKPLLRITASIGTVDPTRPGAFPITLPSGHREDELGLLVETVNGLLDASQHGFDQRDAAQAELAALARDLERRVEERTAELERQKQGVEHANRELQTANRHISDGIRYASRIQTALLPDARALDGIVAEITVGWRPFDIVGGDYYWTGRFGDVAVIAVMDCTGHGVPGAFMTAVVSSILARILHHHGHDDPALILSLLNGLVKSALRQDRGDAPADDGLDAAICILDRGRGRISFAGANLPLTIWSGGALSVIKGDRRSLGYRDSPLDVPFTRNDLPLDPAATYYLYTDGVPDQMGGTSRVLFGRRRLQEVLARHAGLPLDRQREALFAELEAWRGEQPRRDDLTFIAFRPLA